MVGSFKSSTSTFRVFTIIYRLSFVDIYLSLSWIQEILRNPGRKGECVMCASVDKCGSRRSGGLAEYLSVQATTQVESSNPIQPITICVGPRHCEPRVRIGTAPRFALWVQFSLRTNRLCSGVLSRAVSQGRIKMKLAKIKSSLVMSAFLLGLVMAGCSATPAAGPAGPQGPPGPQGASDHDRDHDRDADQARQDQARQDQAREDQAASCPRGEHRDRDRGCVRD